MDTRLLLVYGIAVAAVLILGGLYVVFSRVGSSAISSLYVGADGTISTSKFQFFLWTVVVIFGYVAIYAARSILKGDFSLPNVTPNVLTAIGLSGVTAATAQGITTGYLHTGRIRKPQKGTPNGDQNQGGLFVDDHGNPDLSKVQLLAWTLIAVGIFLIDLWHAVPQAHPELPDIDGSLVVLMGLGQAAYVGTKLTTSTIPRLTGLSVNTSTSPEQISLYGQAFGDTQAGGQITFNGTPLSGQPTKWTDSQISFTAPDGGQWAPGTTVQVGVIAGGQRSSNTLPYTFPPGVETLKELEARPVAEQARKEN